MVGVGEIMRAVGDLYLQVRRTTPFQRKALRAIQRCRTELMGAVRAVCDRCRAEHLLFRSCRNRHCPRCQAKARAAWLEAREQELLPVPYFHVVFTVPEMLNPLALYCPEVFYPALLRAAGHALLDVGRSKLKALLGCLAILHTWGQNLMLHPHVHCVVPGGGFSLDGQRWVSVRNPSYLLPIEVLWRRFRTLFTAALREAERKGRFRRVPDTVTPHLLIEGAAAQKWIAYVKRPFGGPRQVLKYLSRYTHRVAISNSRILSFTDGGYLQVARLRGLESGQVHAARRARVCAALPAAHSSGPAGAHSLLRVPCQPSADPEHRACPGSSRCGGACSDREACQTSSAVPGLLRRYSARPYEQSSI